MKELHDTVFTPSSPVDIDEDDLQVGSYPFESTIEPIDEDDELDDDIDDDIDSWEEGDLWDDELDDDREGFEDEDDDDWDSDEDWDICDLEPEPDPIESAELIPVSWKSYNQ